MELVRAEKNEEERRVGWKREGKRVGERGVRDQE